MQAIDAFITDAPVACENASRCFWSVADGRFSTQKEKPPRSESEGILPHLLLCAERRKRPRHEVGKVM